MSAPTLVRCPECPGYMDERRLDERALSITNGRCSECNTWERKEALRIARERRVAAYGEGRC